MYIYIYATPCLRRCLGYAQIWVPRLHLRVPRCQGLGFLDRMWPNRCRKSGFLDSTSGFLDVKGWGS